MIEARGRRRDIIRAYNLFSFFYRSTVARLERPAVGRGLERAQAQPGERVLDAGVGTGAALGRLLENVGESGGVVGVDLSPRMLRAARRHLPGASLVRADARALPFAADSFDLLWASYLLDLIPTDELSPVLEEFRRVLRPGGRLLLVNFSKENGTEGSERLTGWERLYRRTPAWLVPYVFGGCRPVQAEPYVRKAGFTAVRRQFLPGSLNSEIITARR